MKKGKEYTVREYAEMVGLSRHGVLWQINNDRLPDGIKAEKRSLYGSVWCYILTK